MHYPRVAEAEQREVDRREFAEGTDRFRSRAQILDLGHGKAHVLDADPGPALAQVDQLVLTPVDQRPEQHAADDTEDRGVGADTEREGDHHRHGQALGAAKRTDTDPHVLCEVARHIEPLAVPDPTHRVAQLRDVAELSQGG